MKPRKLLKSLKQAIYFIAFLQISFLFTETLGAQEDCPWYHRDTEVPQSIKSHCICASNPSSNHQLSIQCQDVNAKQLVTVLMGLKAGTEKPLELLYLNGSHITDSKGKIPPRFFGDLKIISLQLSASRIQSVHPDAFVGMENYIKHLSLSQNFLTDVPTESFNKLLNLSLLDLSYNKITKIQSAAFENLKKLATLKLNDNNLELNSGSFKGLETSLRNLNLKGTRISLIPEAISNLSSLAFLDLAQNRLRDLEPSQFFGLHSLTALNLERNLLQTLPNSVFQGVSDTLSSLSLLNNLITHFPKSALHMLKQLRVLDLGFNLLTEIPLDAFNGLTSLTLLALDGNPLASLSQTSFISLNTTLRGISLGGRFLNCDCRVRWILEWIRNYDLQVTSRERNPQFCGTPSTLRQLNFYQIKHQDLLCKNNETVEGDYDVDLSPEDIALLGMGSSPVLATQLEHQNDEDNASEQATDENKTTFTVEIPRNETETRYKLHRPRPTKVSKFPLLRRKVEMNSSNETESLENNGGEEYTSLDTDYSNIASYSINKTLTNPEPKPIDFPPTTTSEPSNVEIKSSTRKAPQAIRPHNIRPKITQKVVTTTSTTVTTKESNTFNTRRLDDTSPKFMPTRSTTTEKPRFNNNPIQTVERKHTSKTIDSVDIDDSKIPVISGVGPSISSSNLNSGNIVAVKQPTPVQTHSGVIVKPSEVFNSSHSSTSFHQNSQASKSMPPNLIFLEKSEIHLKEIERNGDSVVLHWESPKHTSGFRIIYRLFGEDTFRHGPPLAATERDYRIRNIPINECLVVCVVPYDEILYNEINPSATTVPGSQCRELKPTSPSALMNHMDKITIGASAAICVTVLIAVIIFIGITKRAKTKRPPSATMTKIPPTSFMTPSPGPAIISPGPYSITKEWDQMSVISTKSIPRARVYHGSMDGLANPIPPRTTILGPHANHINAHRQGPEGHSTHRSYISTHHHHHNHSMHGHIHPTNTAAAVSSYLNNQSRLLRTSLGSRASYDALNKLASMSHNHRQFEQNQKRRRPGRLSQSESLNTLNGYETPDNWTDHDMDFYVARNPTRHDLVQL